MLELEGLADDGARLSQAEWAELRELLNIEHAEWLSEVIESEKHRA